MKNTIEKYLIFLSKEQVSSAAGICGFESISSGKTFTDKEEERKSKEKKDEDDVNEGLLSTGTKEATQKERWLHKLKLSKLKHKK
jgi:hypothetical protein